jgi:hypothetical protein
VATGRTFPDETEEGEPAEGDAAGDEGDNELLDEEYEGDEEDEDRLDEENE